MAESRHSMLDATGLLCPEPIMLLHERIQQVSAGDVIEMLATDPSTQRDISKFCVYLNHTLINWYETEAGYYYAIRKN